MSVRKGDRQEGKLQVLEKARELKAYSYTLLKSDKYFPKSTRWLYAYPIVECVREASACIRRANSVFVTTEEEARYRRLEQTKAHAHLHALLDLIDDVYSSGNIKGTQADFWTGLVLATDDLLKAWMKADKVRAINVIMH